MKPLPLAAHDFSIARGGAAVHVIQIVAAPPDADVAFLCEQASCSGRLVESHSEVDVLRAMVNTLDATASYYRQLLDHAVLRRRRSP